LDDVRRPLIVRKEGVPDVLLTSASSGAEFLTPTAMAGDWLLMQQREGCKGEAPRLGISVRLRCT
jgi:hypothetical protein